MLPCVGHRVMVPPCTGRRAIGSLRQRVRLVLDIPCKGRPGTHSIRLWCPDGPWEKLMAYKQASTPASRRTVDHRERGRLRPG
ncbi:hypothetical protein DVZ84_08980 [Streptomyces parvulus]|uniref:Uncharacterized protein n=1 Tax=Streptomyces parvulus TaxID=146923 RepID=A0A369VF12_9ACTN|nr:hypothetical protein DVZ84_08980 [Streptomyces parvulus]